MQDIFQSVVFAKGAGNAKSDKMIHGGKGAGLIDMCNLGLNVPPGIIIPVVSCKTFEALSDSADREIFLDNVMADVLPNLKWLKAKLGYMPLLSVRSGAPVSMPGMMDTILNVGAIGQGSEFWSKKLGDRAWFDCQRRLIEMLGTTAYGIDPAKFSAIRENCIEAWCVKSEREFTETQLAILGTQYLTVWEDLTGKEFPTFEGQLRAAIRAVFESWNSERARTYRKLNNIPASYGTAVTIQAMVFGNLNENSGTGVLFSRNPSNGDGGMFGEYLVNAQGEDVVAGTATPQKVAHMLGDTGIWSGIYKELEQVCFKLEAHYSDMVDVEFTVENGKLFVLQSRVGKRSALAAFVVAHDMVEGGLIENKDAFKRLNRDQVITIRLPSIDPAFKVPPTFKGIAGCPGVVKGQAVHTSEEAVKFDGPCILVREETSPDDIAGMAQCAGILTRTGGATSHAAVVARAMDKPCVVGATDLVVSDVKGMVTIDGANGHVWVGVDVPVVAATDNEIVKTVMSWAAQSEGVKILEDKPQEDCVIGLGETLYDVDAMAAFFSELSAIDCSNVILDCMQPVWLLNFEDAEFNNCFGVQAVFARKNAGAVLFNMLSVYRENLKGLTLLHYPNLDLFETKLVKSGFKVVDSVKAVPAEYALFKAIAKAKE